MDIYHSTHSFQYYKVTAERLLPRGKLLSRRLLLAIDKLSIQVDNDDDDEADYPDILLPGWASSLTQYPRLQTISVHFGGNMFGLDEDPDEDEESPDFRALERRWIRSWSRYAPSVTRVYLNHTCDEELDKLVEDTGGYCGRNTFWRRKSTGKWTLEATAENVICFEDPDVLDQLGDASRSPYEEDGITVQQVIQDAVRRRKEAWKHGGYGLLSY